MRYREFRRAYSGAGNGDVKVIRATPSRKRKEKCDFKVPEGEDEVSFSCHNK